MGKFVNSATGVTFSVDDSKNERYEGPGYESASEGDSKPAVKRPAPRKSSN